MIIKEPKNILIVGDTVFFTSISDEDKRAIKVFVQEELKKVDPMARMYE